MTYAPNICKNNIIITTPMPTIPIKNQNWNDYIVLSSSNFANNKKNLFKSIKISKKTVLSDDFIRYIDTPSLVIGVYIHNCIFYFIHLIGNIFIFIYNS